MSDNVTIYLRFSDWDLGESIAASTPPQGVTVSKTSHPIEASEPAQIFLMFSISFTSAVAGRLVSEWLLEHFKKSGKGHTSINRKDVVFEERHVRRFVEEEVTRYYRETTESHDEDDGQK